MKRILCLLLAMAVLMAPGMQAFADDVLFCRLCGRQIPADSRFCSYCGEAVVSLDHADHTEAAAPVRTPEPVAAVPAATPAPVIAQPIAADGKAAAVTGPFGSVAGAASVSRQVVVTKSPTSESVPYGGACMFIAHAANATSVTWYLASSDASLIIPASDGPAYVAGLSVSGTNSDTLYLSGIPASMNGCLVQACFTGEGGPVYTDIARIWTYQPTYSTSSQKKDDSIWAILAEWDPWWDYYNSYDPWWGYEPPNPPDVAHSHPVGYYGYYSEAPESAKQDPPVKPAEVVHVAHEVSALESSAASTDIPKPGPPPSGLGLPDPAS